MLVACRLAGLSALEGHYAGLNALPPISPCGKGGVRQHWAEYQAFRTGKGWGVPHQAPNPPH
jgi:hypothetical protein